MRPAEKWISPFDADDGTLKFHWPHFHEMKSKMVEVALMIEAQIQNSTEVTPWQAVDQGTILCIKVLPPP